MAALAKDFIPAGAVNDMADVFTQPESRRLMVCHDGQQETTDVPPVEAVGDGGSACIRQAAFVFGEQTGAAQSPKQRFDSPPHYAQHTSEVLQDLLGMSKEEVHQLSDEGAVFCRE